MCPNCVRLRTHCGCFYTIQACYLSLGCLWGLHTCEPGTQTHGQEHTRRKLGGKGEWAGRGYCEPGWIHFIVNGEGNGAKASRFWSILSKKATNTPKSQLQKAYRLCNSLISEHAYSCNYTQCEQPVELFTSLKVGTQVKIDSGLEQGYTCWVLFALLDQCYL